MMLKYQLLLLLISQVSSQFLGSSLYNALSGYSDNDMCRYISCPFGQYCWNGNCISSGAATGGMGGLGALTSAASMYGMGGMGGMNINRPVTGYGGMMSQYGMGAGTVGGIQPCSLMQQCLNGQICVNNHCSRSNVAYSGSQGMPSQTTCAMGAVCPVGQFCMGGTCVKNTMSSTFACHNGVSCPMGMMCQIGRCVSNGLPLYGK